jgi:hypothetical protein
MILKLGQWGMSNHVAAWVFYPTASNCGMHRGAAKLIEERLRKTAVLGMSAPHHRILELTFGAVWKHLFGTI